MIQIVDAICSQCRSEIGERERMSLLGAIFIANNYLYMLFFQHTSTHPSLISFTSKETYFKKSTQHIKVGGGSYRTFLELANFYKWISLPLYIRIRVVNLFLEYLPSLTLLRWSENLQKTRKNRLKMATGGKCNTANLVPLANHFQLI